MEGKLCIIKVTDDLIEGYFIAPKRKELVTKSRYTISGSVEPGDVFDVDYSWTSMAVFGKSEEKFFDVEADVTQRIRASYIEVAPTQEEAEEKFKEKLLQDFDRVSSYADIETVSVDVE